MSDDDLANELVISDIEAEIDIEIPPPLLRLPRPVLHDMEREE